MNRAVPTFSSSKGRDIKRPADRVTADKTGSYTHTFIITQMTESWLGVRPLFLAELMKVDEDLTFTHSSHVFSREEFRTWFNL